MSIHDGEIRVTLWLGKFPNSESVSISVPLDGPLFFDALEPLDHPERGVHPLAQIPCSPFATVRRVKKARKDMADTISRHVTRGIMLALAEKDTIQGYPIEKETAT